MTQLVWQRACGGGACVEVAPGPDGFVLIRDSKDPHGPALWFTREEWDQFADAVKADAFHLDGT